MTAAEDDRYSRQTLFSGIGEEGQKRIGEGSVLIVGCGALGSYAAMSLVRAGVGRIKLVDADRLELSNLQRQVLYDESDVERGAPKALAAVEKLKAGNSSVAIESETVRLGRDNAERLVKSADVVVDATDNMETRLLMNDACVKHGTPWVYGAVAGACGMTTTIIPGKSACLRCFVEELPAPGTVPTANTAGIVNSAPAVIASLESAEVLKILMGGPDEEGTLVHVDIWRRRFGTFILKRRAGCPACDLKRFDFLEGGN